LGDESLRSYSNWREAVRSVGWTASPRTRWGGDGLAELLRRRLGGRVEVVAADLDESAALEDVLPVSRKYATAPTE
jgi:hypothetical protein